MSILTPNRYDNQDIKFNNYYSYRKLVDNNNREENSIKNTKRLIHSQTFDNILKNETNWKKDINDYDYNKKHLQWGRNPPQHYYAREYITSEDRIFNPITQKYTDIKIEEQLKQQEKKDITNSIVKGYNNELKNIQTYNIINLENKLKGLEDIHEYPNTQRRKKYFVNPPKINYNILSNLNYKIHHFDKPEMRPNIDDNPQNNKIDFFNNGGIPKQRIVITRSLKDFNIISNDYIHYNKEKNITDLKYNNLKSAKKFYKLRIKNPITGIYYNEDKEKKFQEQNELNIKKLLNKKKEGLYNPFNFVVYDEEGLKKKDKLLENKNLRYKERPNIELYYQEKDLKKNDRYNELLKNKLLYNRFKEIEKRRFDIINNKDTFEMNKYEKCGNKKTPWELIKEGSNENEKITKKQLFISLDKDEIDKKYIELKIKKNEEIKKLPKIASDPFFRNKKHRSKVNLSDINNKNNSNQKSFSMDKDEWFKKNKNDN